MARLPALIDALAKHDDRERSALEHAARVAREDGLITTTKRGVGAAAMSLTDATNLLIAANAGDTPREAARMTPLYRGLVSYAVAGENDPDTLFGRLDASETFGEALEVLIDGAPELLVSFMAYGKTAYPKWKLASLLSLGMVGLEVEFERPRMVAAIRIVRQDSNGRHVDHEWLFIQDSSRLEDFQPRKESDRQLTIKVGFNTVLALCAALLGDDAELLQSASDDADLPRAPRAPDGAT